MSSHGERLRVLYMSPLPPPPGGIESWMSRVRDAADAVGVETEIVDLRSPHPERGDRFALYKLLFAWKLLRQCRRACALGGFDLMHINCSFRRWSAARDYWFARVAKRHGVPVVVHLHGGLAGGREWASYPPLARRSYRALLESADLVIVLAEEVIRDIEAAGIRPRQVVKLPNFASRSDAQVDAPDPDRSGVLYVGRLMFEKGLDSLIRVAQRLPHQEFHWVGRMQADVDIPDNVKWHGERPEADMPAFYRRHSVLLLPSHSEGFPMSVLDGMAAGMAVVATRCGAIPEMILDGAGGYVVEIDAVDDMAERLESLERSPELRARMGDFNRSRVEREYAPSKVLAQLRGLYHDVAGEGR